MGGESARNSGPEGMNRIGLISAILAALWMTPSLHATSAEHPASGEAGQNQVSAADLPPAILGEGGLLQGESVAYFEGEQASVGYQAVPRTDGPHGAVILIHEWNGLVERIKRVADVFAAEGYVALAVDLYSGRIGHNREENLALMREARADPERIIANLDAAARYLRDRPDVSGKIAAMGWCFGGGVALSYALGGERHEGTAIFYGRLVEDPQILRTINHEVYGTFAEMDGGIPPERVERFVTALREAGIPNDVHIYDDVRHGFWLYVERDPETNKEPAAHAWARLKAYLMRTIGADSE